MPRPSAQQLADFQAAEPVGLAINMENILRARITGGAYRTVVGDVLQVEMPRIADSESPSSAATGGKETYACRIGDDGAIVLPMVGPFAVAGRTLAEIETGVLAQYYPKYVKTQFPIYVSVLEYSTRRVSIAGAVAKPGIYALRSDQMSLVTLLMEAGGIIEKGAAVIRIASSDESALASDSQTPVAPESASGHGKGHSAAFRPEGIGGDEPSLDSVALRAMFKREGPLCATGWLVVAGPGDVLVRKWLDLASEYQRSTFLKTVAAAMKQQLDPRLHARLVELAKTLESLPLEQKGDAPPQNSEWRMADNGCYVITLLDTRLATPPPQPRGIAPVEAARRVSDEEAVKTMVLPVRGLNIPFADTPLREGDSVIVERSHEQFLSVLGLVRNPGNFLYPPDARYNLAQAVGFAGGLDMVADPRYVSIYRLRPNGEISSLTVQLVNPRAAQQLTEVMAMPLRPGDVVSVEHTLRTRTNVLLDRIFRVSLGLYVNPETVWNHD